MDKAFWVEEGPEFPKVVFDSIKDNPSFSQLLQNTSYSIDRPWHLSWFREYLHTIRDLPGYGEVLVKIADFLCEETQHERFQDARPSIMASALQVSLIVVSIGVVALQTPTHSYCHPSFERARLVTSSITIRSPAPWTSTQKPF
jgi:hypothetical protein